MTTRPVEFFGIVESGYPYIPYAGDRPRKSAYIDLPNSHFDPIQGQRQLEIQLEILQSMERHGLDGAGFTEQHSGPIGLLPNPLLAAAWLASRTEHITVFANGPLLTQYQSPVRLAEEIALADILTKGRLMVGLPLGLGVQYHALGMNPATARERHAEAHDLLVKALREDGPFRWHGKYFHHDNVNIWPRPAHDIEFNLPGGGSAETLRLAAKRRYSYQTLLTEKKAMVATLERFREYCREEGYEPDPRQTALVIEIHVAETDAEARREAEGALLWNYQNYFEAQREDKFPPGYTSPQSMRGIVETGFSLDTKSLDYDTLVQNGWVVSGSPETVRDQLAELLELTGVGRVFLAFSFGVKSRWLLEKSVGLFAEEVLPHFRPRGRPLWAEPEHAQHGYRSSLEFGVKRRHDRVPPTIVRDGHLVDVTKMPFPDIDPRISEYPAV